MILPCDLKLNTRNSVGTYELKKKSEQKITEFRHRILAIKQCHKSGVYQNDVFYEYFQFCALVPTSWHESMTVLILKARENIET
jgi:hypothetical protein